MQLNVDIIFVHKSVAESCFRFPDVPCKVPVCSGSGHNSDGGWWALW